MQRLIATGLLLLAGVAGFGGPSPQRITARYTPADRERDRYVYVPFDVPAGTTELRVRYEYDRANGQNTIDLGVFEPGPLDIGTRALRGYSGGSKSDVVIGERESTPGYEAGPLPPGRWHVMLGLYAVGPEGVDVTIEIATRGDAFAGPAGRAGSRLGTVPDTRAAPRTPRWWSGALHTHTVHSDGAVAPAELLGRIQRAGLDFVAITDHNTTTYRDDLWRHPPGDGPLWIAGEEVTTPGGHANVWGLDRDEWVDFRVRPQDRRINELADAARAHGALFSINHPFSACAGCSWEHETPRALDAIEVWNGRHGAQGQAVELWERLLREGRRVTAVGASDWHRDPDPIDRANVRVLAAELTERAILAAIRGGHVIVMRSAADPTPAFTVRMGDRTAMAGQSLKWTSSAASIEVATPRIDDGHVVVVVNGTRLASIAVSDRSPVRIERALEPGFLRAEVYAVDGSLVALTNPVFITR